MRFHFGVSFRLKTLKKFLFPILIGILAYFGINFLGLGIINVNALENYDTSYTFNYSELIYLSDKIDDNISFIDFSESLKNLNSQYYNIITTFKVSTDSKITGIGIILFDKSLSSLNFNAFGNGYGYELSYWVGNPTRYYYIDLSSSISDIYNNSIYLDLYSCLTNNTCNNIQSGNYLKSYFGKNSSVNNNNNNNTGVVPFQNDSTTYSYNVTNIYYSDVPLVLNDSCVGNGTVCFFKNFIINDITYTKGDFFPTYYDLFPPSIPEEPDDSDNPTDNITEHKALFNKIYWFDDNLTDLGVLSSIYELLFLYCITMVFFRIATLLKNKRW